MPVESNSTRWTCKKLRRSHEIISVAAWIILVLSTLSASALAVIQVLVLLKSVSNSTNSVFSFFSSIFHYMAIVFITLLVIHKLKLAKNPDICILEAQEEARNCENSRLLHEQLSLSAPLLGRLNSYLTPTPPPSYIESSHRTLQPNPMSENMRRHDMTSTPRGEECLFERDYEISILNESDQPLNRQNRNRSRRCNTNLHDIEMQVIASTENTNVKQSGSSNISNTTETSVSLGVDQNMQEQNRSCDTRHMPQTSIGANALRTESSRSRTKAKRRELELQNIHKKHRESNTGNDLYENISSEELEEGGDYQNQSSSTACPQNCAVSPRKKVRFATVEDNKTRLVNKQHIGSNSKISMMLPNQISGKQSSKPRGVLNFLPCSSPKNQLTSDAISSIPGNETRRKSKRFSERVDKTTYECSKNSPAQAISPSSKHQQGACGQTSSKMRTRPETIETQHHQENTDAKVLSERVTRAMLCDLGILKRLSNAERPDHANKLVAFDFESFKSTPRGASSSLNETIT